MIFSNGQTAFWFLLIELSFFVSGRCLPLPSLKTPFESLTDAISVRSYHLQI